MCCWEQGPVPSPEPIAEGSLPAATAVGRRLLDKHGAGAAITHIAGFRKATAQADCRVRRVRTGVRAVIMTGQGLRRSAGSGR